MKKEKIILKNDQESRTIYGSVWAPEGKPVAVLQLIHGMTEYIDRYDEFATYFTNLGYLVCGFDLESHGRAAHQEIHGLYIDHWNNLIEDVELFRSEMHHRYPEIPYVMLGFSLGSFILRSHQCVYPEAADKLIYVGTGQPKRNELKFAHWLISVFCKKDNRPSELVKKLAFDNYNRKFKHSKSGIDWLLKDGKAQEDYLKDQKIITDMTPRFFLEFLNGMMSVQEEEQNICYKKDVLFLAGEEDPVANGLNKVIEKYKKSNANIKKNIIPRFRHDVLHDSCKETVFRCIADFL